MYVALGPGTIASGLYEPEGLNRCIVPELFAWHEPSIAGCGAATVRQTLKKHSRHWLSCSASPEVAGTHAESQTAALHMSPFITISMCLKPTACHSSSHLASHSMHPMWSIRTAPSSAPPLPNQQADNASSSTETNVTPATSLQSNPASRRPGTTECSGLPQLHITRIANLTPSATPSVCAVPCCQAEGSRGAGLYYRKASDTTGRCSQGAPAVMCGGCLRHRLAGAAQMLCRATSHSTPLASRIWCGSLPATKHLAPPGRIVGNTRASSAAVAGAAPPTLSTHLHACRQQCRRITLRAPHSHLSPPSVSLPHVGAAA